MRVILFVDDKKLALDLVEHYTMLSDIVFYHYLSSHNICLEIDSDLDLTKELNREVIIVVYYHNDELLNYMLNYYNDKEVQMEVI